MRALAFAAASTRALLLLALWVGAACSAQPLTVVAPHEPRFTSVADVPAILARFPRGIGVTVHGLDYLGSSLFVATNVGLLEVRDLTPHALYRWHDADPVISGPWLDAANGALWARRETDSQFVRRTTGEWKVVGLPKPPNGNFTRGDALRGFKIFPTSGMPHLVGAGHVWRWTASGEWVQLPSPPRADRNSISAYARIADADVHVEEPCVVVLPQCAHVVHVRSGETWQDRVVLPTSGKLRQALSTADGLFVRDDAGTLALYRGGAARKLDTPGPCEAIARTSKGALIGSFGRAGIHAYEASGWRKLAEDPYDASEGEHWAYLAERDGEIAFATQSLEQYRPGPSGTRTRSGTDALWVTRAGKLVRVPLVAGR